MSREIRVKTTGRRPNRPRPRLGLDKQKEEAKARLKGRYFLKAGVPPETVGAVDSRCAWSRQRIGRIGRTESLPF